MVINILSGFLDHNNSLFLVFSEAFMRTEHLLIKHFKGSFVVLSFRSLESLSVILSSFKREWKLEFWNV